MANHESLAVTAGMVKQPITLEFSKHPVHWQSPHLRAWYTRQVPQAWREVGVEATNQLNSFSQQPAEPTCQMLRSPVRR